MKFQSLLERSIVAVVFIVSIFLFKQPGFCEVGVTDDTVKIGATGGLTGPVVFICTTNLEGAKVYFDHINASGGIHGRKIKFIIEDDGYMPAKTVAAAKKLITRDKVFCLCDTQGSATTSSLKKLIGKEKIPLVSPHSPPLPFTEKYLFWAPITYYSDQVGVLIEYAIKQLKMKKPTLGMVYQEGVMGKNAMMGLDKASEIFGLKVVGKELYKRGAIDFSSQVFKMRKANPDIVILQSVTRESAAILSEMKKIGWNPITMGTAAAADAKVIELAGSAAKKFYVAHSVEQPQAQIPGMKALLNQVRAYSPKTKVSSYFTIGYISGMIMVEGLKRAGRDLTREKLVEALESMKRWDPNGLAPLVTYGKDDRVATKNAAVFKANVEEGRFEKVTGWVKASW